MSLHIPCSTPTHSEALPCPPHPSSPERALAEQKSVPIHNRLKGVDGPLFLLDAVVDFFTSHGPTPGEDRLEEGGEQPSPKFDSDMGSISRAGSKGHV